LLRLIVMLNTQRNGDKREAGHDMSARSGEIEKTGRNLGGSLAMVLRGATLTGLAVYETLFAQPTS
jgi:hypothetical protein